MLLSDSIKHSAFAVGMPRGILKNACGLLPWLVFLIIAVFRDMHMNVCIDVCIDMSVQTCACRHVSVQTCVCVQARVCRHVS